MIGSLRLQIRRYGSAFAILIVTAIAGSAAGIYILLQQRLPNPFQSTYELTGEFPTVAAVAPGLGEPVQVAGVRVGQISGVSLAGGRGIVHMTIDPGKLPHVYQGAHAALVPNTPLKDMQVDVFPGDPGTAPLAAGAAIPVAQTVSPTDADDLLLALDADTRSWFTSLVTDLDTATRGRAADIRRLLRDLGPTSAQIRRIGDLLASRRRELAAVVTNLGVLTRAAATRDTQLTEVVRAGAADVQALASQDTALRDAIARLPGTLSATRQTLADLTPFARALGPAADALIPTARRLPKTLANTRTLFDAAAVLPLSRITPFVAAVTPLAAELTPLGASVRATVPPLVKSFKVVHYITNELAYVPGGRNPGFLYWLAWFAHNVNSFLSTGDANGPVWRGLLIANCASLKGSPASALLQTLTGSNFGCTG